MFKKLNSTVPNVFQQNRFMPYSYHTYETRNNLSIRTPLFNLLISKIQHLTMVLKYGTTIKSAMKIKKHNNKIYNQ